MSEKTEVKEQIQKKDSNYEGILEKQKLVVLGMELSEEAQEILTKKMNWKIREHLYFCVIDGVDLEILKGLPVETITVEEIMEIRKSHWTGKADVTPAYELMEKMVAEIVATQEESQKVIAALKENNDLLLRKNSEKRSVESKKNVSELASKLKESDEKCRELEKEVEELKSESLRRETESSMPLRNSASEENQGSSKGLFSFLLKKKREKQERDFLNNYLSDEKWTKEQRSFFVQCLAEGLSVKEIDKFACPALSVDNMMTLKNRR